MALMIAKTNLLIVLLVVALGLVWGLLLIEARA